MPDLHQSREAYEDARVAAEVACYGSLKAAIAGLWNDSCGAPMGSQVHIRLNLCLAEQSRRNASAQKAA